MKPLAPSSSGATTWTEEEVAEFEDHIGELTAELKVLRQEAKGNSTEYSRNKGTVANMRGKFAELREARDLLKAARAENEDLKAALAEERANSLGTAVRHPAGFKQARGAVRPLLREHDGPRDAQHGVDAGTDQRDHP